MLGILTTAIEYETADSVDELVPWDDWNDDVDVAVHFASDPAQARGMQIGEILTIRPSKKQVEEDYGRSTITTDHTAGWARDEPENGEIKRRRFAKRGDGTRRHGRPPDLALGGPFGHSESWNMGVYPGRGPALISRADMILLPPTKPSAIIFKDPLTPSVVVSDLVVAGETASDTLTVAHAGLSAPGPSTSTTAGSGSLKKSPTSYAPELS